MLWLILIFSLITRLWNLSYPPNFYFDEVYNAFTTLEFVKGNKAAYEWFHTSPIAGTAYGWTHPPLAKLLGAVGILIFGPNAFGWRIANALIGVGVIYLIYLISLHLLRSKRYALLAATFASLDGLLLTSSRINMNDIVAVLFVLLSFLAFISYQLRPTRYALFRFGLILGLLIATKWTGLYALAVFGIWLGLQHLFNFKRLVLLGTSLVLISAAVYLLSYSQYFFLGGTWANFVELQKQMWWYNTRLTATHTYQSSWWTWPIMLRPVWYFVDYAGTKIANIYGMGNPILWWLGIPALLYTLYSSLKTRSWRLWLVICGFLAFWLPWARAPRIMFLYHYLPSVPFLYIALAYTLQKFNNKFITFGILGLGFVAFVYFYPHWTAIHIPQSWASQYFWLSSWK